MSQQQQQQQQQQQGLSRVWDVVREHRGFYTGGKTVVSKDGATLYSWCNEDVTIVDVASGQVTQVIESDEDGFTTFAVHPTQQFVATASRSRLIRVWDVSGEDGARQVRVIKGHELPVLDLAFDPTGTLLASGSADRSVKVFQFEQGFCTHSLRGHRGLVNRVMFHPDVERLELLSFSDDGDIRCWPLKDRAKANRTVKTLRNHISAVTCGSLTPDGKFLVSGGRDKVVNIWNMTTYKHVRTLPLYDSVESVTFLPPGISIYRDDFEEVDADQLYFVTAGEKGLVRVFDFKTRKCVHTHNMRALPNGSGNVVRANDDLSIENASAPMDEDDDEDEDEEEEEEEERRRRRRRRMKKNGKVAEEEESVAMAVAHLFWCPAAAQSNNNNNHNGEDGDDETKRQDNANNNNNNEGGHLVAVTHEHNFCFYDVVNSVPTRVTVIDDRTHNKNNSKTNNKHSNNEKTFVRERLLVGFNDEIIDAKCLPDNQRAVVVTNSEQIRVFDMHTMDAELLTGHEDIVMSVSISHDGAWMVSGGKDRTVRLWSLATTPARCVAVCEGHAESVGAVAIAPSKHAFTSPSSSTAFAVSASRDRTIKVWDCSAVLEYVKQQMQQKKKKKRKTNPNNHVDLLNGLDVPSKFAVAAHDMDINTLAVSPNDQIIVSGSQDKTIKLWRSKDLSLMAVLRGHRRGVWSVCFSPVDRVIASASGDRTVKIWSLTDFSCLRTFEGHTASVLKVSFLNLGMQLMSCGSDGLVKLWTIKTNECANTFSDQHSDKIWALDIAPDQKQMITGGADSVLCVWEDRTVEEADEERRLRQSQAEQEQELNNAERRKEYVKAATLALNLNYPRRLRSLVDRIVGDQAKALLRKLRRSRIGRSQQQQQQGAGGVGGAHGDDGTGADVDEDFYMGADEFLSDAEREDGDDDADDDDDGDDGDEHVVTVDDVVTQLSDEHLIKCVKYARDWNTSARYSRSCHELLGAVFRAVPHERLTKLFAKGAEQELLAGVQAYNDRHFARMDRLMQQSYLFDYTFQQMKRLDPLDDADAEGAADVQSADAGGAFDAFFVGDAADGAVGVVETKAGDDMDADVGGDDDDDDDDDAFAGFESMTGNWGSDSDSDEANVVTIDINKSVRPPPQTQARRIEDGDGDEESKEQESKQAEEEEEEEEAEKEPKKKTTKKRKATTPRASSKKRRTNNNSSAKKSKVKDTTPVARRTRSSRRTKAKN